MSILIPNWTLKEDEDEVTIAKVKFTKISLEQYAQIKTIDKHRDNL